MTRRRCRAHNRFFSPSPREHGINSRVGNTAPRRAGFSLVELLVVIAVVVLLAGIILPALNRSRERARKSVCVGNLRQVSIAALMYHDDAGVLPTEPYPGYLVWNGSDYLLHGRLLPTSNRGLSRAFFCPSSDTFTLHAYATGIQNLGVPGKVTASAYFARSANQGAPIKLDGNTRALIADLFDNAMDAANHAGGANVAYTDGGVRFWNLPDTWDFAASNAWYSLDLGSVNAGL